MYKSKSEIEKKLNQVKYAQNMIRQFQGRVLADDGRDRKTGARPLIVYLSALVSQGRSVIQYAHKEAKETWHLAEYDRFVKKSKIFRFFKRIRDCDIHEYTIGAHTTIYATAYMRRTEDPHTLVSDPGKIYIETLSELNRPGKTQPDVKVVYTLCERVETTEPLIEELERRGQVDLVQAARSGKEIYAGLEFEGTKNLHEICDLYVAELEKFVVYGQVNGFIS
ncbi:MAG: hypothetical protein ACRD5H_04990 [Nitrososphaerales archaeon]